MFIKKLRINKKLWQQVKYRIASQTMALYIMIDTFKALSSPRPTNSVQRIEQ
nr:hypothetical protein Q903MT_gene1294 [Picea sitchensis]